MHQVDQLLQLPVRECAHGRGRAVQDGFGGSDRVESGWRQCDELTAVVIGMGTTFDEPVLFELVNDDRDVRASRLIRAQRADGVSVVQPAAGIGPCPARLQD